MSRDLRLKGSNYGLNSGLHERCLSCPSATLGGKGMSVVHCEVRRFCIPHVRALIALFPGEASFCYSRIPTVGYLQ